MGRCLLLFPFVQAKGSESPLYCILPLSKGRTTNSITAYLLSSIQSCLAQHENKELDVWARQYTFVPTPRCSGSDMPVAENAESGGGPDRDHFLKGPTSFSPASRPATRWPAIPLLVFAWQGKQTEAG